MNSLGNRLQDGELQAESLLGSALENKTWRTVRETIRQRERLKCDIVSDISADLHRELWSWDDSS